MSHTLAEPYFPFLLNEVDNTDPPLEGCRASPCQQQTQEGVLWMKYAVCSWGRRDDLLAKVVAEKSWA